ncbi:hypothetical protein FACS1894116_14250 [Betaproteobacteria bacterium]|nr:hypothetical protein FACS1894116_14250 [Betaproteobacteria bacterium]GHU32495.1 hypothetical protein FACS189497_14120 [Betaproteobacteria bacterium]
MLLHGYSLIAGAAIARATPAGALTAGAFFEHGEGDYDSHNSFANAASVRGNGDTEYTGGGVLAHFAFNESNSGKLYVDGSARIGRVETDFGSDLIDAFGRSAAFNAKSRYLSSHLGAGYLLPVTASQKLDLYGQYLWSHQDGDTVKLTTGEAVKFKDANSRRLRLGAKWRLALEQNASLYLGAAWEHEYDGKAKASIQGYALDTPKLKGDTASFAFGFAISPTATRPVSFDFGIQGYTGQREGVTGNVRAGYRF